MTNTLQHLTKIAARILRSDDTAIDPDTPLEELRLDPEEVQDIFEEACETLGIPIVDIINTMPIYRFKRGDAVMWSLMDISAFSPKAAQALQSYTTKVNLDTLRSMAQSIDQKRYVPSGRMSDDIHQPSTKKWVIGKGVLLSAFALGVPLMNAIGPCNPICRDCFATPTEKFWEIGIYTLPLYVAVVSVWFGPGLYDLWRAEHKHKRRKHT